MTKAVTLCDLGTCRPYDRFITKFHINIYTTHSKYYLFKWRKELAALRGYQEN
jgi:hypothetical protein